MNTTYQLSKKELANLLNNILKRVSALEKKLIERIDLRLTNGAKTERESLTEAKNTLTSFQKKLQDKILGALKKQENGMNFIRDEVNKLKDGKDGVDGKDADEDKVSIIASERAIEAVKPLIPTTDGIKKEILNMGKLLRKALKRKLKISDIQGLREELDKRGKTIYTGSGGAEIGGHVRYSDISASLDGATRTFSLPAFSRVLQVNLSSFPNILRENTDFTVNGSTFQITFTSEISLNALSSGQTCVILYATQ